MMNGAILICIIFTSTQLWIVHVNARPLLYEASEFMTGLIKELAKNKITSASMMDWDLSVEKFVDELMKDEQVVMQGTPPIDEEMINERNGVANRPNVFGDIVLTPEQKKFLIPNSKQSLMQGFFEYAIQWPDAKVPYELHSTLNAKATDAINRAIEELESKSCIRFVQRTSINRGMYPNYVSFEPLPGCLSYIGMIGNKQVINIGTGCEYKGLVQHEILHALGRVHEQSRPDREFYVRINEANIQQGREFNFAMMEADTKNLPYDYGSIMHYDLNAFSSNGKPTMSVLFPTKEKVGQRNGLSKFDWQWLDKVYCTGE